MKQLKNLTLLLMLIFFLSFEACTKKEEEVKINPCIGIKKADFKIYEQVGGSLFESDKALLYNFVEFKANEDYESYSWTIGDDDRIRTTKKVRLYFPDPTRLLQIRLIATRKPRPDCLPNDKGIDTIVKTFQAVSIVESKLLGKFQGFSKQGIPLIGNPLDTFTVNVYQNPRYPTVFSAFVVDNFKKGYYPRNDNPDAFNNNGNAGYRAMQGDSDEWYVINKDYDSIFIKGDKNYYSGFKRIEFKGKILN